MTTIIGSIRDFARATTTEMRALDINRAIESAILLFDKQIYINGIVLEKQLGRGLPLIVGNVNQLVQLFTNIISNSIM